MFTFIVIASILAQTLTALFVLEKNRKSITNILFFFLSVMVASWALINFIITHDPFSTSQLILYRLLMAAVITENTFFFLFAHTYPDVKIDVSRTWLVRYLGLSLVAITVAVATPLVFAKVSYGHSGARPIAGPGMLLFGLHAAISVISGLRAIHHRYKKSIGLAKQQLRLIYIGSIILWGVVPITNFAVSLATQTLFFARISPIYTLAFSSIIAYAIVAQKLFDIRSAVARSVGYIMVVVAITLIYGMGLFGVIDAVFRGAGNEHLRQVLSVILIAPLAIQFQSTKTFFDKITNRLFYRDAYDTQDVIDKFGSVVVSEIELFRILKATRTILTDALKTSFVEFVLIKNDKIYFEAQTARTHEQGMIALGAVIREQHRALVVIDEMRSPAALREKFEGAGVALSLRLKTHEQDVGYILFGDKRSGDIYTNQDKKLLEILASQLSISMQNALRFEEIQNFNLTLQAKVDGATRNLRHVNEKLKALDETKDDFISMASHQLRTPLTSVKGYISLVLEGDAGKLTPLQKQMLEQAYTSSQRMVYLIADLLNVSRLKTGKFIIETKPVNLAKIVNEEMAQLKETAKSRQLTMTYAQPEDFPEVMLDETKIRQVIMNFADNAIYYTPAGGKINVELVNNPTTIELRIIDNGLGVPKAEQPHLFTKFYRAGNARKARPDGTGLGLFMAKKVIAAQGGALIFNSTEGKGSTFGFVFSKQKMAVPEIPVK